MKIPPNAKQVFKGVIFDVYQWQQEMFDGSFETFERVKRPHTLEVIAVKGDKIIIAEQEQPGMPGPIFTVFGGRAEEGETELEGAKRELLDEAGLDSDDWELFKTVEPEAKIDWKIHYFIARNCKKIAEQNLEPGEKITIKEVTFEEFVKIVSEGHFWGSDLALELCRIRLYPEKLEVFRKKLFKKLF